MKRFFKSLNGIYAVYAAYGQVNSVSKSLFTWSKSLLPDPMEVLAEQVSLLAAEGLASFCFRFTLRQECRFCWIGCSDKDGKKHSVRIMPDGMIFADGAETREHMLPRSWKPEKMVISDFYAELPFERRLLRKPAPAPELGKGGEHSWSGQQDARRFLNQLEPGLGDRYDAGCEDNYPQAGGCWGCGNCSLTQGCCDALAMDFANDYAKPYGWKFV